jgi:hypothetical protein
MSSLTAGFACSQSVQRPSFARYHLFRRALVEAAWRYRYPARVSETLRARIADDFANPTLVRVVKLCLADKRPVKVRFQLRWVGEEGELIGSTFPTFPGKCISGLSYSWPPFAMLMTLDPAIILRQHFQPIVDYVAHRLRQAVSHEALERLAFLSFDSRGAFDDGSASLAMLYLGEIMTLNEPLAHYRVHGNNMSSWPKPTIALLRQQIRIFREMWDEVIAALNFDKPPFTDRPLDVMRS